MSELDDFVNQATDLEPKKLPKLVKGDPGGVKAKAAQETALELTKTALKRVPRRAVGEAHINFENAVGGRQSLIDTLKFCPESSSAHRAIQKLLIDAAVTDISTSLSALCFKHRVRFESLALAFKDAITAKLAVEALTRLAEQSDEVFEQVATHALDRYDDCPVCEGKKRVKRISADGEWVLNEYGEVVTQLCYNCRGTGKIFKEHDVQDRKLYLEIVGVVGGNRGPLVNINQNAIIGKDFQPGDGSFERLVKAVDVAVGSHAQHAEEPALDVECVIFDPESQNPA